VKILTNWLPAIGIMGIIFALSSVKGVTINEIGLGKESYHINGHFVLFVGLCFAYYKATKNILLSVLFTIAYGISDEIHQKFTPGRSSSSFDIFVDSTGAVISGIVLWKLQPYLPKKLKNWLNK
jgi:VanZ family protein